MQPQGGRWEQFAQRGEGKTFYRPTDMEFGPDGSIYICGWGGDYHYDREAEGSWIFRITNSRKSPPAKSEWWPDKRGTPYAYWTIDELVADLRSDTLPVWRVKAQDELVRRGAENYEALVELMNSDKLDRAQQTWLVWALSRAQPNDSGITQLSGLVFGSAPRKDLDSGLNLRIQVLRIIGSRAARDEMKPRLVAALNDPEPRIRFEAVQAIWQSHQSDLVSAVVQRLGDEQDRLVFYAGWKAIRSMLSADERKHLLADARAQVRLAGLLSLLEDHSMSLDEVMEIAEGDDDERIQNWAMTWALNPQAPKKMPNSQSRIEQEESVSIGDLMERSNKAKNARLRQLYLSMISRATYDNGKDDWEKVRDFYQTLDNDNERALALKPLARENHAKPILWQALAGNDVLRQSAIRGLVSLSKRFGNSPIEIADFLISEMESDSNESRTACINRSADAFRITDDVDASSRLGHGLGACISLNGRRDATKQDFGSDASY